MASTVSSANVMQSLTLQPSRDWRRMLAAVKSTTPLDWHGHALQ